MSKTNDIRQQNELIREKYLNSQHFHIAQITQVLVLFKVFEKYI